MINERVLPGPARGEPFRGAGTFQGLSVNVELVVSEHSVRGSHRLHLDKVSDKVSDKGSQITPNPKLENVQSPGAGFPACGFTGHSCPVFPTPHWRLESRQNPQTRMSVLPRSSGRARKYWFVDPFTELLPEADS